MKRIHLIELAHARSGDKGNTCNIGLICRKPDYYPILIKFVTAERVRQHFEGVCLGKVGSDSNCRIWKHRISCCMKVWMEAVQ